MKEHRKDYIVGPLTSYDRRVRKSRIRRERRRKKLLGASLVLIGLAIMLFAVFNRDISFVLFIFTGGFLVTSVGGYIIGEVLEQQMEYMVALVIMVLLSIVPIVLSIIFILEW